jgi:hypothetical protein
MPVTGALRAAKDLLEARGIEDSGRKIRYILAFHRITSYGCLLARQAARTGNEGNLADICAAPAGTQGRCPAGSQSCRSRPFGQSRSLPSGWGHWHSKCQVAASSTGEAQPYPREGFTHWRSLRHIDCNESNMAAERVTTVGLPKAWLIESSCKDASMAGCAIEVASGPEPTTG